MLRKFLFIGVGGSGGKTLRMIHDDLRRQLQLRGYRGPLPEGWQFVQIDVPVEPDGNSPTLPPQLPAGRYLGLASKGMAYSTIDSMLMQDKGGNESVRRHVGGWRPDPQRVIVNPAIGAGQYRAVGRVVAAASIKRIAEHLNRAITRLSDVSVDNEFKKIAELLGTETSTQASDPIPVIVSSIAGGSGSGLFLDVCDALRMIEPTWGDSSVGVLYTPDVFDDLPPAARAGVRPNALAALSEVMAGYWNNEEPSTDEFAILAAAGVNTRNVERRGPRYPLLVGKSNDVIKFSTQEDVYKAVAKQLTTFVTSAAVQDTAWVSFFGNWGTASTAYSDDLPLAPGRGAPFSSFGFASVGLGREAFLGYASERLARASVERLLRAHWDGNDVPRSMTPEAACEKTADQIWHAVLEECGLNERTRDYNQILDAIKLAGRDDPISKLQSEALASVTANKTEIQASTLEKSIFDAVTQRRNEAVDAIRRSDIDGMQKWSDSIQPAILDVISATIADYGLPVSVAVVERIIEELREVVKDLESEAASYALQVNKAWELVRKAINSFGGVFQTSNPQIQENINKASVSVKSEANAALRTSVAALVDDLVTNFMTPLRLAMENARQILVAEQEGSPSHPSPFSMWPERAVPERFSPPLNEVFLDEVDSYPGIFEQLVCSTEGIERSGDAIVRATRDVIVGSEEFPLFRLTKSWVPQSPSAFGTPPSKAAIEVSLGLERVLESAAEWATRSDTAVGMFTSQTLADYLDSSLESASVNAERLKKYESGLQQAMKTARPLVKIDPVALMQVYPSAPSVNLLPVMTPFPFPAGHPARDVTTQVLLKDGMDTTAISQMFGDQPTGRIDVTMFLEAPFQPMVFESITGPIRNEMSALIATGDLANFWNNRRARPLTHSLPLSPDRRRAAIRGWFLARLLGLIELSADQPVRIYFNDEWSEFPFPLLGPKVVRTDEMLAAILESLPLALLGPTRGGPMDAYRALIDIGESKGSMKYSSSVAPEVLENWLANGTRPEGAPVAQELYGPADRAARVTYARDWVKKFELHFSQLNAQSLKPEDLVSASRSWEIRTDIALALQDIDGLLERSTGSVIGADEVG